MNGLSDADALRQSLAEPSRFAAVYERHLAAVHDYLRRRVGEGPAEDLAAEVFVRAFRGRSRYGVQYETALPWLLGIATNVIGDHRRTETRRLAALEQVVAAAEGWAGDLPHTGHSLFRSGRSARAWRGLAAGWPGTCTNSPSRTRSRDPERTMPNTTIDEVLLSVRDAGLADPDVTGVDALCRARLQAEIEREHRAGRRRSRFGTTVRITTAARFAAAVGVAVTIAGATYAVPATRAAVDDIYSAFSDWVAGDAGSVPGRAVAVGEDGPPWAAAEDGEKRLLAAAGGENLVAIRQGDKLTFALAAFGTTATIDDWRRQLAGARIVLVGPGRFIPNGRHDLRPLFGLVSASIKRIRFNYADGGPAVSEDALAGAFGMTIETNRRASSLTGYDQAGRLVARLDFVADPRDLGPGQTLGDFRYCPNAARGCPPWPK